MTIEQTLVCLRTVQSCGSVIWRMGSSLGLRVVLQNAPGLNAQDRDNGQGDRRRLLDGMFNGGQALGRSTEMSPEKGKVVLVAIS
jgi:hypothetical protein